MKNQLKNKQNPLIKLQLTDNYKLLKLQTKLYNIKNKQNCITLKTKQIQHIFYFNDMNYINKLLQKTHAHSIPKMHTSKSLAALLAYSDNNENKNKIHNI